MNRTILSLYDYTGKWSQPYADDGYDVIRIDLQRDNKDARLLTLDELPKRIHGIIAAPPCTVFAASGARWPRTPEQMAEGLSMVDAVLRYVHVYQPEWWVLENPIGKLVRYLGKPAMYFNPSDYAGHADDPSSEAYTKRTCLWGSFNTQLPPASLDPANGSMMWAKYGGKSQRTKNARSATPLGFARAFREANP